MRGALGRYARSANTAATPKRQCLGYDAALGYVAARAAFIVIFEVVHRRRSSMGLQITRLLALQGVITTVIAGAIFVWGNSLNAVAALLGGAAAAAAAAAYGLAYRIQGGAQSSKPLRTFLVAELCRIGAALALLMAGMVALPGEAAIAYLGAFAAALFAYLLIFLF